MNLLFLLMAFVAGCAISTQSAINGQLAAGLGGNAVAGALVSFAVGTVVLFGAAVLRGNLGGAVELLPQQPWWRFAGGWLGAGFIFCTTFLAPRIGLLNLLVLVIAGQLVASMGIDQFGLVGMNVRRVSAVRLTGALVVLAGVALTVFGDRLVAAMGR
jgi:transporter family-2 protein